MNVEEPLTVFYNRNGVLVTNRWLSVQGRRYDLDRLSAVTRSRGSVHTGAVVALVIAVAEAVIFVPVVGMIGAPIAILAGVFALMIPCAVAIVCVQRWPSRQELLADYDGVGCLLFGTSNEREFGQVVRALVRAMEAASAGGY